MRVVILGRSIGLKKPQKKTKKHKKYRNRRPWYPRATTLTLTYLDEQNAHYNVKNVPVFVPVCLYMLLICSFFRLKELFQVKNGLTTMLLFFCRMPKIWVCRTMLNGEKKRMALPLQEHKFD